MTSRRIRPDELFPGAKVTLRLVTFADCSERYVSWLSDPLVNRYLETRWSAQTLETIRAFVADMIDSPDNYLFAILRRADSEHVGNLKIGPIHPRHSWADVSYFLGVRSAWGEGLATDAIALATRIGFERLGLHRLRAGVYAANVASRRALEKAGYVLEGTFRRELAGPEGWEDHLWYGRLLEDPEPSPD